MIVAAALSTGAATVIAAIITAVVGAGALLIAAAINRSGTRIDERLAKVEEGQERLGDTVANLAIRFDEAIGRFERAVDRLDERIDRLYG
jgi:ubiquinone biosynthesis protein UbiJ